MIIYSTEGDLAPQLEEINWIEGVFHKHYHKLDNGTFQSENNVERLKKKQTMKQFYKSIFILAHWQINAFSKVYQSHKLPLNLDLWSWEKALQWWGERQWEI